MYFLDSFCLPGSLLIATTTWSVYSVVRYYWRLSRVLHVTLANPQTFGFEFHVRSLPRTFSGRSVNQPLLQLHFADANQVDGCNSWLSVSFYHVIVPSSFLRGNRSACFIFWKKTKLNPEKMSKTLQPIRPCLQAGRVTLARGLPWHSHISSYFQRRIYKAARVTWQ